MTHKDFETKWSSLIEKELIKKFPDEFIELSDTDEIIMPEKTLMLGSEFFGRYEIVDASGNIFFNVDHYSKVKYVLYANRHKPKTILQPKKQEKIISAVKEYERLLDSILRDMERDYKKEFPDAGNFPKVSNHIFTSLKLNRY